MNVDYNITEIRSEIGGRGFEVAKRDGPTYHVLINCPETSCECMDFLRRGFSGFACKHVRMVQENEHGG